MDVFSIMNNALEVIVPPGDRNPRTMFIYRVRVTVVACSAFCGLIAAVLLSLGYFPKLFAGFAREDELQVSIKDTRKHWAIQIEDSILSLRSQECSMTTGAPKQLYTATIQRRVQEYYELTGISYSIPGCGDL